MYHSDLPDDKTQFHHVAFVENDILLIGDDKRNVIFYQLHDNLDGSDSGDHILSTKQLVKFVCKVLITFF